MNKLQQAVLFVVVSLSNAAIGYSVGYGDGRLKAERSCTESMNRITDEMKVVQAQAEKNLKTISEWLEQFKSE